MHGKSGEGSHQYEVFTVLQYTYFEGAYASTWMARTAVISPYAEQVKLCAKQIKAVFGVGANEQCPIDVNTVDGFQGREKDFVLFSAVRAEYVGDTPSTLR